MGGSADRWVWVAFLLVLLLSGLIAYVGDLIGRRIGRKRLTIFGLRPKRTAILFTVVTGMLISGVAMTLLLLASEGARKRILEYNSTVNSLQTRIDEQAQRRREAQARADAAQADVEQTERELNQSEVELKAAKSAQVEAQKALSGAEQRTEAATKRAAETQRRVVDAEHRLQEARTRYDLAQKRLQQAEQQVREAQREVAESRAELNENTERLKQVNDKLQKADKQLEKGELLIGEQYKVLTDQRKRAEDMLLQAQKELLDTRTARDEIVAELGRVQNRSDELLEGELIVRFREELGRSLFRYRTSRAQIEQQLETFLRSIDREARSRGAAPATEAGDRAAILPGESDDARDVYRLNVIDFLSRGTENQAVWLRAISTRNTVAGQTVVYQLRAVPDKIVFSSGERLGEAIMSGSDSEATLARQLETLVREQVNPKARQAGLLPNLDGAYTRIGPEKWLPVLREIQQREGTVTVDVVAAKEIRTGAELAVDFTVRNHGDS